MFNENYLSLYKEIDEMPVIDTHEHFTMFEELWLANPRDVLCEYLIHYFSTDLISSGLSKEQLDFARSGKGDLLERWKTVEPFWEKSRYTGYGRALDIAAKELYGIDEINGNTILALNEKFQQSKKPGRYKELLQDICKIEYSLIDVGENLVEEQKPNLKYIWQPWDYCFPFGDSVDRVCKQIEKNTGLRIISLDNWLDELEAKLEEVLRVHNVKVLKFAIAYCRTLQFKEVPYSRAKKLFEEVMDKRQEPGSEPEDYPFPLELQDYLLHYLMEKISKLNLTCQFHTGLLESNANTLSNSDPSKLNNLFLKYPEVNFDLFHISYPYQNISAALCKMFPNVTIDMCWAHIISPGASVAALCEFLDAVPYNKISAFGGDYNFIDGVYAHLRMAKQNVAKALAIKVEENVFSVSKAAEIAHSLFYDNPKRIFTL